LSGLFCFFFLFFFTPFPFSFFFSQQYWGSDQKSNVNFLQGMVDELNRRNQSFGIYSSASQWNPIMGGSTQFSKYSLWYPHYDNNPSFSDWSNFGGWTSPSIKQYIGTTGICGASVDKSWYP
jgi:GH25 family lysozyme M1 (1,4-beta-N-acetylmuramidase)